MLKLKATTEGLVKVVDYVGNLIASQSIHPHKRIKANLYSSAQSYPSRAKRKDFLKSRITLFLQYINLIEYTLFNLISNYKI